MIGLNLCDDAVVGLTNSFLCLRDNLVPVHLNEMDHAFVIAHHHKVHVGRGGRLMVGDVDTGGNVDAQGMVGGDLKSFKIDDKEFGIECDGVASILVNGGCNDKVGLTHRQSKSRREFIVSIQHLGKNLAVDVHSNPFVVGGQGFIRRCVLPHIRSS